MYTFTCIDVIDHGHCATATFETADKNSRLHLYIYAGDSVPTVGDSIDVAPKTYTETQIREFCGYLTAHLAELHQTHPGSVWDGWESYLNCSAPVNLPADPPVPANPLPSVLENVPGQEGEAAADHQNTGGDVQPGEEQGHSVDLGASGNGAGAVIPLAQVYQLQPTGISAVDSIASLPMVADTEVHEESAEPTSLSVAPLSINIAQESVHLGDLQVNLSTVDAVALSDRDGLLPAEVLGGTTGQ